MSHRATNLQAPLQAVPCYDDDAFVLTERVPRVVVECSKANPVPRIHEVSAPSAWGAPTFVELETVQ